MRQSNDRNGIQSSCSSIFTDCVSPNLQPLADRCRDTSISLSSKPHFFFHPHFTRLFSPLLSTHTCLCCMKDVIQHRSSRCLLASSPHSLVSPHVFTLMASLHSGEKSAGGGWVGGICICYVTFLCNNKKSAPPPRPPSRTSALS